MLEPFNDCRGRIQFAGTYENIDGGNIHANGRGITLQDFIKPAFPGFPGGIFKPVVRIHTNAETGLQWYIHEGDLVSTTQLVTHEAGGKRWTSPEWVVGRPVPTKPVR